MGTSLLGLCSVAKG